MKKKFAFLAAVVFSLSGILLTVWGVWSKPRALETFLSGNISVTIIRIHDDFRWKFYISSGIILILIAIIIFAYLYFRKTKNSAMALTAREKEILNLVRAGKSNKEIASALFISHSTVKTHIHNIFKKLNVTSREELL